MDILDISEEDVDMLSEGIDSHFKENYTLKDCVCYCNRLKNEQCRACCSVHGITFYPTVISLGTIVISK